MTEDLDPAGARRLNRGIIVGLGAGALFFVVPVVLAALSGPIATALCALAGAAAVWFVARSLHHPR